MSDEVAESAKNTGPTDTASAINTHSTGEPAGGGAPGGSATGSETTATRTNPACTAACARTESRAVTSARSVAANSSVWKNATHVLHTDAEPPSRGSSMRATS